MSQWAIVADDLTGALDAAAPFAARGLRTLVALDAAAVPECLAQSPQVLGICSNSREVSAAAAAAAVQACLAQLPSEIRLFKKIDSRLKGNIAAELDAIGAEHALVVPAIPAFARWVRNQYLGGFGVAEPIDIAKSLGRYAGTASIPDIETQADIAAALAGAPEHLPVGARGLAEALATQLAPAADAADHAVPAGPIIFVIGSVDPITKAQLAALREAAPDLVYIAAPNGIGPEVLPERGAITLIEATAGAESAAPEAVAQALAKTLARLHPQAGDTLVLSGGATAQALLQHLGIKVLQLLGEVQPGLPLARANGLTIITKSGGFGDRHTLARLVEARGV